MKKFEFMRTFRQLCDNDPKVAIRATIDGLLSQARVSWLKLDMRVFAVKDEQLPGYCCACAATFAVLQLKFPSDVPDLPIERFEDELERYKLLDTTAHDLEEFERAIDDLRQGDIERLFDYFDILLEVEVYPDIEHAFCLTNQDWERQLHLLIYYWEQLAKTPFVPTKIYCISDWQYGVFDRLASFKKYLSSGIEPTLEPIAF